MNPWARVAETPCERAAETAVGTRPGLVRVAGALWDGPLWAHAMAVTVVLVLALVVTRPLVSYSTDEGAAILQAQVIERTGGWIMHDPVSGLDPEGAARSIPKANVTSTGRAPYAKHPLYPLLLLGASEVAGPLGYWLLSVLGTLLAAITAALLAQRLAPLADRLVLWGVAVGSPLFFDSGWVLAHSLAAATAGGATVLAVIALSGPRPAGIRQHATLVGAAVLVAITAGLRSEGLIFGVALAAGALVWAALEHRWLGVAAAGLALAGAGADRAAERLASEWILGSTGAVVNVPGNGSPTGSGSPSSFFAARVDAVRETLLRPSYGLDHKAFALAAAALLVAVAGYMARRRSSPGPILAVGAVVAGLTAAWVIEGNRYPVPGLLVACPAMGAAALCVRWRLVKRPLAAIVITTALAFGCGVVLTEYHYGGGNEWGGRFFAVGIPVIAVPLGAAVAMLERPQRRALVAVLAGSAALLAATALVSMRDVHRGGAEVSRAIARCAALAGSPGSLALDSRPLVVTTRILYPQADWQNYFEYEWLAPPAPDLDRYISRAGAAGVRRLVLVSADPSSELPVPGFTSSAVCPNGSGFTVVVLQRAGH